MIVFHHVSMKNSHISADQTNSRISSKLPVIRSYNLPRSWHSVTAPYESESVAVNGLISDSLNQRIYANMTTQKSQSGLNPLDTFPRRHLGLTDSDIQEMLGTLGLSSLEALINATVPGSIRQPHPLNLPSHRSEQEVLDELRNLATQNTVSRSFIGMGYYDCITPSGHSAKYPGESCLVHAVHSVPS